MISGDKQNQVQYIVYKMMLYTRPSPICGSVVAEVRQEVAVYFPEDLERDASVRSRHIAVCFTQDVVVTGKVEVLCEEFVCESVALEKTF